MTLMHEHESDGGTFSKSHILIMALGCLVPVILIAAVFYAGIESQYLPLLLVLLCPLLMLLMHLPRLLPRKKRTEETHDETHH